MNFHNILFPVLFLPHIPTPFCFARAAEQEEVCAAAGSTGADEQGTKTAAPTSTSSRDQTQNTTKNQVFHSNGQEILFFLSRLARILKDILPLCFTSTTLCVTSMGKQLFPLNFPLPFLFHLNLFLLQRDIPTYKPSQPPTYDLQSYMGGIF